MKEKFKVNYYLKQYIETIYCFSGSGARFCKYETLCSLVFQIRYTRVYQSFTLQKKGHQMLIRSFFLSQENRGEARFNGG